MSDLIVRFLGFLGFLVPLGSLGALGWLLAALAPPPRGRHRLVADLDVRIPAPPPRFTERLDGLASPIVRPYVLTPGERRLGIDTGPRHIHGVPVPVAAR